MTTFSVVDSTGTIINRIILDDVDQWPVPEGCSLVDETEQPSLFDVGGTYIKGVYTPPALEITPPIHLPVQVLSQDLMAQFTPADAVKIKAAIDANISFWLLWSAMQAQSAPMDVSSARFLAGWSALVTVLGADRMTAIATALGIRIE